MNRSVKLIAVAALVLAAGQAMAVDDNVDVKVTGVISPPACIPTISGGAVFDYGAIPAASIPLDEYKKFPEKVLSLDIVCSSPMKVAFKAYDGRAETLVVPPGNEDPALYGLGSSNGKNIGNFKLLSVVSSSFGFTIDGKPASLAGLKSPDNGTTWQQSGISNILYFSPAKDFLSSIGVQGTNQPIPFTTLHAGLKATVTLNKGSELDLTMISHLDGLATIEMVYL